MPLPFLAAAAGISAITGLAKTIKGFGDLADAKALAKTLVRPKYNIQDEYYTNQSLAQNLAQQGLTQESKDYYSSQADRGLSVGADAILRGGGNVNSFNNLYDNYLQGNERVAAEDSQLKLANIKNLMDRNLDLAGQKTQQWAINEYEPYKDQLKAISGSKEAATQNIWGGLSQLGGTAATLATANSWKSQLDNNGVVNPGNVLAASYGTVPVNSNPNPYNLSVVGDPNADYMNSALDSYIKRRYPSLNDYMTSNRATV